jgi:hypothetical protein
VAWGYSQVDGIVPIGSINLGLFAGQTGFTSSAMSRTLGLSLSSAAPAPAVKTPWTPPPKGTAPLADSTRLADAMRKQKFIDESDASLSKTGVPKDHLKLFALYKGISISAFRMALPRSWLMPRLSSRKISRCSLATS